MEIEIREKEKRVYIWLSHAESMNSESLKALFKEFKAKKYIVAVYESGSENLEDTIREIIKHNKVRLRELEKKSIINDL